MSQRDKYSLTKIALAFRSCLIARNLLPGLKTCVEVSSFMNDAGEATSHGTAAFPNTVSADNGRGDIDHMVVSIFSLC